MSGASRSPRLSSSDFTHPDAPFSFRSGKQLYFGDPTTLEASGRSARFTSLAYIFSAYSLHRSTHRNGL